MKDPITEWNEDKKETCIKFNCDYSFGFRAFHGGLAVDKTTSEPATDIDPESIPGRLNIGVCSAPMPNRLWSTLIFMSIRWIVFKTDEFSVGRLADGVDYVNRARWNTWISIKLRPLSYSVNGPKITTIVMMMMTMLMTKTIPAWR